MVRGSVAQCVVLCVALCVAGCGGKQAGGEVKLTTPRVVPAAPVQVFDVRVSQTYDEPSTVYLAVERKDLSPEENMAYEALDGDLQGKILPLDAPAVPERLRGAQSFTLITEQGPLPSGPSNGVVMYRGAGEDHFIHALPVPAELGVSEPVEVRIVAVPATSKLPATARTRAGEAVAVDSPAGVKIVEIVRAELEANKARTRAQGDEVGDATLEFNPVEHIQIVRGKFGGANTLLVSYAVPRVDSEGHSAGAGHFSGLFLLDEASGKKLYIIEGSSFEAISIRFLVDLEGDGVDEIRFESGYYEGSYEYLMRLRDGKPEIVELSGDGA